MILSFNSFLEGGKYALAGIGAFYRDWRLWKYALWPWLVLGLFYLLVLAGGLWGAHLFYEQLQSIVTSLPDFIAYIAQGFLITVILVAFYFGLSMTISSLYEIFGGFFFDSMIEAYEQKYLAFYQKKFSVKQILVSVLDGICFCIETILLFGLLFIVSLFFPWFGFILTLIFCGYRTGISYLQTPAFNCGCSLAQLRKHCKQKYSLVLGFGVTSYLLLLIPLAPMFILPGLILGSVNIFHKKLKDTN